MIDDEERGFFEDAESIYQETAKDPVAIGVMPPPEMREMLLNDIKKIKEEKAREDLSEADKRLLELGRIYLRKRKNRKYFALATVVIFVCALGITGIGDIGKIFSNCSWKIAEREQENIHSQEVDPIQYVDEEEVYQEIEEKFGILPVRMMYLPESTEFQEAQINDELQEIHMIYGTENNVNIVYMIRPNYREGSWGKDIEDKLLEKYEIETPKAVIQIKKYQVDAETIRWLAMFEYHKVNYSIAFSEIEKEMLESVIQHLYFPE